MIDVTEIATAIYRIALWDEDDLVRGGFVFPGATLNMFLIRAQRPVIIQTLLRKTFERVRKRVEQVVDPAEIAYVVVPHHEGDSSGAINEWLEEAPHAVPLCSELCAVLSLRDFSSRAPRVVADDEVVDLGTHRLRFLITPYVNQWDSLMVYEETTRTLFPNDLFSSIGTEITTAKDHSEAALKAAREIGYQADDRKSLLRTLSKIEPLDIEVIAPMHGPAVTGNTGHLIRAFRDNPIMG
jgi:flavorubredoxin